jgi:hypothetical protein
VLKHTTVRLCHWIELKLDPSVDILNVTRCDNAGNIATDGDHWRVIRYKCGETG